MREADSHGARLAPRPPQAQRWGPQATMPELLVFSLGPLRVCSRGGGGGGGQRPAAHCLAIACPKTSRAAQRTRSSDPWRPGSRTPCAGRGLPSHQTSADRAKRKQNAAAAAEAATAVAAGGWRSRRWPTAGGGSELRAQNTWCNRVNGAHGRTDHCTESIFYPRLTAELKSRRLLRRRVPVLAIPYTRVDLCLVGRSPWVSLWRPLQRQQRQWLLREMGIFGFRVIIREP